MNYYNEIDPKAAAWLRELIKSNLIPQGEIDARSIRDVRPEDLRGFTQCHFFAGIGGWSYALELAGWPENEPVWTGSCPCQPFSCAGKGLGEADERHLWPVFRELIRACQPAIVFGEQVASAAGRLWLAGVFADLEAMAYQRAAADLCAAGVGAPHIRQRLYWLANSELRRSEQFDQGQRPIQQPDANSAGGGLADANQRNDNGKRFGASDDCGELKVQKKLQRINNCEWVDNSASPRFKPAGQESEGEARNETRLRGSECGCESGGMDNPVKPGLEGHPRNGDDRHEPGWDGAGEAGPVAEAGTINNLPCSSRAERQFNKLQYTPDGGCKRDRESVCAEGQGGSVCDSRQGLSFWSDAIWHQCRDGKGRRISPQSEIFPLANVVPGRVGLLRGAGNAIVPQVAAEFIQAAIEAIEMMR